MSTRYMCISCISFLEMLAGWLDFAQDMELISTPFASRAGQGAVLLQTEVYASNGDILEADE